MLLNEKKYSLMEKNLRNDINDLVREKTSLLREKENLNLFSDELQATVKDWYLIFIIR